MTYINLISRRIANFVGFLGTFGIIVMMVHITTDVLARLVLGSPLIGTNEIVSRYYMVAIAFLPLAWAEHRNAMISVELIDGFLGRGALLVSDIVVGLVSVGALLLVASTSLGEAMDALHKGAFVMAIATRIPIWPTYFIIPIGCALAAVLVVFRMIPQIRSGKPAKSNSKEDL
jgi:TRAP-type C4-dicarboxylate transport system permease small subunit